MALLGKMCHWVQVVDSTVVPATVVTRLQLAIESNAWNRILRCYLFASSCSLLHTVFFKGSQFNLHCIMQILILNI